MSNKALNEEQRKLVEENHKLIFDLAYKRNLNLEVWYGDLAIGLCKAGLIFDPSQNCKFSTLAYACMNNEIKNVRRNNRSKNRIPEELILSFDMPYETDDGTVDLLEFIEDKDRMALDNIVFYQQVYDDYSERDKRIIGLLTQGYTQKEIASQFGYSHQNVNQLIKKIHTRAKQKYGNAIR